MEINWMQKRAELWQLLREAPHLSNRQIAHKLGMLHSWTGKWKKRLKNVGGTDIRTPIHISQAHGSTERWF